jgi:hypothetical protein
VEKNGSCFAGQDVTWLSSAASLGLAPPRSVSTGILRTNACTGLFSFFRENLTAAGLEYGMDMVVSLLPQYTDAYHYDHVDRAEPQALGPAWYR